MKRTIIVGGGAAGMLAAIGSASAGNKTVLIEQNEKLGKKMYISGKGRCNLTNIADRDEFFNNIVTNPRFLYSAFSQFGNYDIMAMLEGAGVPLKTERGGRVFPQSDKSSDVLKGLTRLLKQHEVELKLKTRVKDILVEENKAIGVLTNGGKIEGDRVILATGGKSYPATGSTGDGYAFAKKLEIAVTELTPSLVPIVCSDSWIGDLMGLSLKNVALHCEVMGKEVFSQQGEMLFTHFGISGPLVLTLSALLGKVDFHKTKLWIDFKPALDETALDKRLVRDFDGGKNKQFVHAFDDLLPRKLIPVMLNRCEAELGVEKLQQINSITKQQRKAIGGLLKRFTLTPIGYRPIKEAIITKGGVDIREIDPRTMESKKIKGLYFVGELLDLDALTGGFNLQIAYSTGYCAGAIKEKT